MPVHDLGINVKKVNVDLYDPDEQRRTSRAVLESFLNKKERVYCLIIREDYDDYISQSLKERTFILAKEWYWRKPNQLRLGREAIDSIIKRDRGKFKKIFKNEIYLISNRRG